ncbi:MAG TPA: hypothetical protein VML94_08175 [Thermoplasmata archaeon]|nr:hypothetical protein [Thermoplasmata archaeon]
MGLRSGLAGALASRRMAFSEKAERERRRRRWLAGAAVVVAALSVLAGFAYYDLGGAPHPSSSADPTSFYTTLGPATSTARSSFWSWPPAGPSLVFAEGLASGAPLGPAVNASHLGATLCAPTLILASAGTLPAFGGTLTAGLATEWLYAYLATGNALVVVAVEGSVSEVVATTPTNGACYNGPGAFMTVPIDSTVAAGTAGATAKSTTFFASAGTNSTGVSAEFFLAPPGYVSGAPKGDPMWVVTDTTCALYGNSVTSGSTLTTVVDAGVGGVVSQRTTSGTC